MPQGGRTGSARFAQLLRPEKGRLYATEMMAMGSRTSSLMMSGFFFFQAEDGIRDVAVTGVQTCALPISVQTVGRGCESMRAQKRQRRYPGFVDWGEDAVLCRVWPVVAQIGSTVLRIDYKQSAILRLLPREAASQGIASRLFRGA